MSYFANFKEFLDETLQLYSLFILAFKWQILFNYLEIRMTELCNFKCDNPLVLTWLKI